MARFELFGSSACPYTQEMREWLEWRRTEFVEYDVDTDPAARERMRNLSNGPPTVPMLLEDGKVIEVGWQGRGCVIAAK